MEEHRDVVVVTGAGGMGAAVARRLGSGRTLLVADASQRQLEDTVGALRDEGYTARGVLTDVSDRASVERLAATASADGRVTAVVHTAGVSPATAPAPVIVDVDMMGTAHVIDVFESVASRGTSLVCIASMAGHCATLSPAEEDALATTPTGALRTLDVVAAIGDEATAYVVSKRSNQLRVQAAALAWNGRGARVNSVSPGVVATGMAKAEEASPSGAHMRRMLEGCGAGRSGTPGEIADAVAFLTGPQATYITGTDILVDGGQTAWVRRHRPA